METTNYSKNWNQDSTCTNVWFGREADELPFYHIHPLSEKVFASYTGPESGLTIVHGLQKDVVGTEKEKEEDIDTEDTMIAGCREWSLKNRKAYGLSMSLYDQHPITANITGDPIADCFGLCARLNGSVMVVADGVNWGEASRLAARCAVYGAIKSIHKDLFDAGCGWRSGGSEGGWGVEDGDGGGEGKVGGENESGEENDGTISTTKDIFSVLMRSLKAAHHTILKLGGGLTTLCVCVVCPIIPPPSLQSPSPPSPSPPLSSLSSPSLNSLSSSSSVILQTSLSHSPPSSQKPSLSTQLSLSTSSPSSSLSSTLLSNTTTNLDELSTSLSEGNYLSTTTTKTFSTTKTSLTTISTTTTISPTTSKSTSKLSSNLSTSTKSTNPQDFISISLINSTTTSTTATETSTTTFPTTPTTTATPTITFPTTPTTTSPPPNHTKYITCVVNVGDSLAFVFSRRHGVREVTTGSHDVTLERDIRDAGGALGPARRGGAPELNNLTFSQTLIDPGDVVFLATDGVTDNFDPVVTKIAVAKKYKIKKKKHTRNPDEINKKNGNNDKDDDGGNGVGDGSGGMGDNGDGVSDGIDVVKEDKVECDVGDDGDKCQDEKENEVKKEYEENKKENGVRIKNGHGKEKDDEEKGGKMNGVSDGVNDNDIIKTDNTEGGGKKYGDNGEKCVDKVDEKGGDKLDEKINVNKNENKNSIDDRNSEDEENDDDDDDDEELGLIDGKPVMLPFERHRYAIKEMERILHEFELMTECSCSAQELCGALLQHVLKVTDSKRKVLENPELYRRRNRKKRLTEEEKEERDAKITSQLAQSPGKLDHATIIGFEVGCYHGNEDEDYEEG